MIIAGGLFDFLEFDCLGQFRHHELTRVDHLKREVHSIDLAHAGEQLHGQQGVAPEFEEIVVYADGFDIQEFGPQDGEIAFQRGARGVDGALRDPAARGDAQRREDLLGSAQFGSDSGVGDADWDGRGSGLLSAGRSGRRSGGAVMYGGGSRGREAENPAGVLRA